MVGMKFYYKCDFVVLFHVIIMWKFKPKVDYGVIYFVFVEVFVVFFSWTTKPYIRTNISIYRTHPR